MEFVNKTPVPARIDLGTSPTDPAVRGGMVTAKATFRFDEAGDTELDTEQPYPLFETDEETELGLLPRDDGQSFDPDFDVILLGAAHAPSGEPVEKMTVRLTVGDIRRKLAVFGDRQWTDGKSRPTGKSKPEMSRPKPFVRMPIGSGRAFGGTTEVLIDEDSPIDLREPINPAGLGWDASELVQMLGDTLNAPKGYPKVDPVRPLPNCEGPDRLIKHATDRPMPAYWDTVPMQSGLHANRMTNAFDLDPADPDFKEKVGPAAGFWHRAHPEWVITTPAPETAVHLEGLRPEGTVSFWLPRLRILADVLVGDQTSTHELVPQSLVLLPEEMGFYLVYRCQFAYDFKPGDERSLRLRTEEGWYPGASESAS